MHFNLKCIVAVQYVHPRRNNDANVRIHKCNIRYVPYKNVAFCISITSTDFPFVFSNFLENAECIHEFFIWYSRVVSVCVILDKIYARWSFFVKILLYKNCLYSTFMPVKYITLQNLFYGEKRRLIRMCTLKFNLL